MDTVKFHFDNVFYDEPKVFAPYRIYQVGDIDTYSGFKCKPHKQIADEITYIVSGNANMLCGDKTYQCRTGDVIFNPKGTMHAIDSADGHSLRYYYIAFDINDITTDIEKTLSELLKVQSPGFAHADRSISHTFHDIFLNINSEDKFSDVIIADSIRKLLMYTLRSLEGRANNIYMPDMRFGKKRTVAQICSFIDDNIEDIAILKKLPEKFGYSYSHISAFFSKSMGLSLKEYFLMSRHRRECELLSSGFSVTAVADKMGYSAIHVFSKAFTAREGIPPSTYAEKIKDYK